ncbi:MAG: hypothetical protein ABI321_20995 [Polyangia bacterium]
MRLVVIEDGDEYATFVRALVPDVTCVVAKSAAEALRTAVRGDAFLVDLRFDRVDVGSLVGDVAQLAGELFGGDEVRAMRHLVDEQGIYVLKALRAAGHDGRAIFVHDFSARRLGHLRVRYGDVVAMATFDAAELRRLLGAR